MKIHLHLHYPLHHHSPRYLSTPPLQHPPLPPTLFHPFHRYVDPVLAALKAAGALPPATTRHGGPSPTVLASAPDSGIPRPVARLRTEANVTMRGWLWVHFREGVLGLLGVPGMLGLWGVRGWVARVLCVCSIGEEGCGAVPGMCACYPRVPTVWLHPSCGCMPVPHGYWGGGGGRWSTSPHTLLSDPHTPLLWVPLVPCALAARDCTYLLAQSFPGPDDPRCTCVPWTGTLAAACSTGPPCPCMLPCGAGPPSCFSRGLWSVRGSSRSTVTW
jgi:hypothetical protein